MKIRLYCTRAKSSIVRNGLVVPKGKEVIKPNSHGFEEICGAFITRRINSRQNINRHFQSCGRFRLLPELLGNGGRMKNNTSASPRNMRKQPMFNGVMFRAVRRIVGYADVQP